MEIDCYFPDGLRPGAAATAARAAGQARRYRGLADRVAPYGADLGSARSRERWRDVLTSVPSAK